MNEVPMNHSDYYERTPFQYSNLNQYSTNLSNGNHTVSQFVEWYSMNAVLYIRPIRTLE